MPAQTGGGDSCAPLLVLLDRIGREAEADNDLGTPRGPVRCHILAQGVDVEILGELAPGAFHYGMTCLVEYETHSLWHEMSLTITAEALKKGTKVEYHVFQHSPSDIKRSLADIGVALEKYESKGTFRIMDSYSPTTPLREPHKGRADPLLSGRVPDAEGWADAIRAKMLKGFEDEEKRWLHVDDNEAVLLQFSDEDYVVNGYRTTFVPMTKARDLLVLHAMVTGVASESFYRKRESLVDAVIDVKAVEEGRKLEHYIRLRALRGARFDSSWRRIELFENNRVRLSSGRQVFGFQSDKSEKIFSYLLKSFVDDHMVEKQTPDSSGWRTLVETAQGIGAPKTSLYSAYGSASLKELTKKGVIERKVLARQRGRGGRVTRVRIAYDKGFVREYVDRYLKG